jgi:hypothetical protein
MGTNFVAENEYPIEDCAGECGGDAEEVMYYLDIDNDTFGAGIGYELCNQGLELTGWVLNNNDEDDNSYCETNSYDCAGVCDGDAEDFGCGCGEAGPSGCDNECGSNAEIDCNGVCDGGAYNDCACTADSFSSGECIKDCF